MLLVLFLLRGINPIQDRTSHDNNWECLLLLGCPEVKHVGDALDRSTNKIGNLDAEFKDSNFGNKVSVCSFFHKYSEHCRRQVRRRQSCAEYTT